MTPSKANKSTPSKLLIIFSALILASSLFLRANQTLAQSDENQATEASVPVEEIKDNIKERLEKAISLINLQEKTNKAWVGTLESIANHTLTIETRTGIKLASVSAETTFVTTPKRSNITLEDLEIGSYTIAMGNINGNQVLNASRVVIQAEAPETPIRQAQFASIIQYDETSDTLTLNLGEQNIEFVLGEDSQITSSLDAKITIASIQDISPNSQAIIITKTETEDNVTTTNLIKLHLLTTSQTQAEIPQESSPTATDSSS